MAGPIEVNLIRSIFTVLGWILVALGVLLIAVYVTGREARAYPVLAEDTLTQVGSGQIAVRDLAVRYHPLVYKQPEVESPPLLWLWYNAVDAGDHIDLIYYFVWQNEINPIPLIHRYYSIFRAFYYGYPLYDIEYFQVGVAKGDGSIASLMFETGPSDDFYSVINAHIVVQAGRLASGEYQARYLDRSTQAEIRSLTLVPEFDGEHVKVAAQTWNHLSTLVTAGNDSVYTEGLDSDLVKNLSAADYSNYKFVRKSQGSHVTRENRFGVLVSAAAIFILVTLPAMLLSRLRAKKGK